MVPLEHEYVLGHFISYPLLVRDLFGESSIGEIVSGNSNARSAYFDADEIVVTRGDPPLIIALLNGTARLSVFNHIDRKILTTELHSDQIIGVNEVLANHSLEFSVKTISPCTFSFVDPNHFIRLLKNQPDICFRLFKLLSEQLHASYQTFSSTVF